MGPVGRAERIVALDIIRGWALLGVLLMNTHDHFRGPAEVYAFSPHPSPGMLNAATDWVLALFFEAKSVTLFSFLFGVGLAIQLERVAARGQHFGRYAVRRLGALLLFGALHVVLFWWGDILHVYACLGFLLLLFLRRSVRTQVIWGTVFVLTPWFVATAFALIDAGKPYPPYNPGTAVAAYAQAIVGHGDPSWLATLGFRLRDWWTHTSLVPTLRFAAYGFGLFLLGLAGWRHGVLRAPERHLPTLRRIVAIGLPIGLAITFASLLRWNLFPYTPSRLGRWMTMTRYFVAPLLMAAAYASTLLLLLARPGWRARLAPLSFVGRMALTSYITHSVVMTWIFNGYGLGLYGRLGPAPAAGIALALFAAQVAFSRWWLGRHPYGPLEWLWRALTYGRRAVVSPAT